MITKAHRHKVCSMKRGLKIEFFSVIPMKMGIQF